MARYNDKEFEDYLTNTIGKVRENFVKDKVVEPVCLVLGNKFVAVSLMNSPGKKESVLAIKKLAEEIDAFGVILIHEGYRMMIEPGSDVSESLKEDGSIKVTDKKIECVSISSEYFTEKEQIVCQLSYADIARTDENNPALGDFTTIKGLRNEGTFSGFLPKSCKKRNLQVN